MKVSLGTATLMGGTAVYRLYNGSNYEHFYTSNRNEYNIRGSQGWTKEGIA